MGHFGGPGDVQGRSGSLLGRSSERHEELGDTRKHKNTKIMEKCTPSRRHARFPDPRAPRGAHFRSQNRGRKPQNPIKNHPQKTSYTKKALSKSGPLGGKENGRKTEGPGDRFCPLWRLWGRPGALSGPPWGVLGAPRKARRHAKT